MRTHLNAARDHMGMELLFTAFEGALCLATPILEATVALGLRAMSDSPSQPIPNKTDLGARLTCPVQFPNSTTGQHCILEIDPIADWDRADPQAIPTQCGLSILDPIASHGSSIDNESSRPVDAAHDLDRGADRFHVEQGRADGYDD
jgi:hypothetical protein